MIKFTISDKVLIASDFNDNEISAIKECLSWTDKSNAYVGGKYNQRFVKKICMIKPVKSGKNYVCFAGFAKEVFMFCKQNGIDFKVEDTRTHYKFQEQEFDYRSFFNPEFKYTDHQVRALEAMHHSNYGIIKATTGSGKGDTIPAFMKMSGLKTLVLCDKISLAIQNQKRIQSYGIDCGICNGKGVTEGFCMVSTIQSVKKIQHLKFECVIVDECHLASSKSFSDFFKATDIPYRYGFSATMPSDFLQYARVREHLGSVIVEIKAEELMENGVIAIPTIKFITNNNIVECSDFQYAYQTNIVHNKKRNQQIADIANSYKKGVAILVNILEHGEELLKLVPDAIYLQGSSSIEEREKIINDFEEDKVRCIIGSSILNTGISINNIQVLIIASGLKSSIMVLQRAGRSLRLHKDKINNAVTIYDFYDKDNYILEKHSKDRIRNYAKEGFKVEKV
jgi:superfamily II DNA or RNA helicase